MSVFGLPTKVVNAITSLITRGIHWCNLRALCRKKIDGGLGFRDLMCVNESLLAKQGWRLLHRPEALVSKVLKGKYFPNSDFVHASLGSTPSQIWRSIFSSKDLLDEGMVWKIGNGRKVNARSDKWIQAPPLGNQVPHNFLVADLRTDSGQFWDSRLLDELVCPEDKKEILKIPVVGSTKEDRLMWFYSQDGGLFSVKSGYWLAMDRMLLNFLVLQLARWIVLSSGSLWKLKVAPKVEVFLWRALSGRIPVRELMCKKGLGNDRLCPICSNEIETISHVLLYCPSATVVWFASPWGFRFEDQGMKKKQQK